MNRQSYYTDNYHEASIVSAMQTGDAMQAEGAMQTGGEAGTPVTPLPSPSDGGPVGADNTYYPGVDSGSMRPPAFRPILPGSGNTVTVIPGVAFPCSSCNSNNFGRVRLLNASSGYQPFYIYLGNWLVASQFGNGTITNYLQAASGTQTVTVAGSNGYVYVQKQIQVREGASMTVAVINAASGLDIMEISDSSCNAPSGTSCLRTVNLSLNQGPFDISVGSSNSLYTPFTNVRYREITPYTSFYPGWYQIYISRTDSMPGDSLAYTTANMNANTSYTLYLFNAANTTEGLRTMVVAN